ncbi:hypothetical protein BEN47_00490 [Hymenobacter lapidarius]|uniref:Glycosyltransferase RgtA/B/C/D-like domain-containing protein n=1 Tax=Hymenobacter lapidarius TaxID=1908237 RepID=A0A1G1T9Y1_9BACT|nr:hypothetical protein [Hymenobacter lapidarius]OGX87679.1 hypothetical protein BEN47_00490 [Hymenobacter lapidarius]
MKVALAILLNIGLLAVLLPWLGRQWRWAGPTWWRLALVAGLGLRLGVGLARNWALKLDAEYMSSLARDVTTQIWTDPAAAFQTFMQAVVIIPFKSQSGGVLYDAVFQSTSNTWILIKIIALLNLGSLGVGWINSFYISVFAFVGCWQLVRCLRTVLPGTPAGAGAVAFLLWPTAWFWATGISKESILLGSGAWLTARVLGSLYGPADARPRRWWQPVGWWLATAALAWLHFHLRYFFALPLLGVLGAVALARGIALLGWRHTRMIQGGVIISVLAAGLWVLPQLSVAFSINKFTYQVIRVYSHEVTQSVGKPHVEYPNLRPTIESIAAHAPLAAANSLTRPWLGESRQPLYIIMSLENAGLVMLFALALVAAWRRRSGHLPFELGVGLVVFCVILAVLIGLTTPNYGSLSRYRSGLLPFLVFLLLQNDYAAALLHRLGLRAGPPPATTSVEVLAGPAA